MGKQAKKARHLRSRTYYWAYEVSYLPWRDEGEGTKLIMRRALRREGKFICAEELEEYYLYMPT